MNMKKIISTIIIALSVSSAVMAQKAQYKVEESSARNMPEWVLSTEKDYLIVRDRRRHRRSQSCRAR